MKDLEDLEQRLRRLQPSGPRSSLRRRIVGPRRRRSTWAAAAALVVLSATAALTYRASASTVPAALADERARAVDALSRQFGVGPEAKDAARAALTAYDWSQAARASAAATDADGRR